MANTQQSTEVQSPTTAAPDILAPVFADTNVSLLEMAKLQAQVLVPVLKALRAELGETRANQLVSAALRDYCRSCFATLVRSFPEAPGKGASYYPHLDKCLKWHKAQKCPAQLISSTCTHRIGLVGNSQGKSGRLSTPRLGRGSIVRST